MKELSLSRKNNNTLLNFKGVEGLAMHIMSLLFVQDHSSLNFVVGVRAVNLERDLIKTNDPAIISDIESRIISTLENSLSEYLTIITCEITTTSNKNGSSVANIKIQLEKHPDEVDSENKAVSIDYDFMFTPDGEFSDYDIKIKTN